LAKDHSHRIFCSEVTDLDGRDASDIRDSVVVEIAEHRFEEIVYNFAGLSECSIAVGSEQSDPVTFLGQNVVEAVSGRVAYCELKKRIVLVDRDRAGERPITVSEEDLEIGVGNCDVRNAIAVEVRDRRLD